MQEGGPGVYEVQAAGGDAGDSEVTGGATQQGQEQLQGESTATNWVSFREARVS